MDFRGGSANRTTANPVPGPTDLDRMIEQKEKEATHLRQKIQKIKSRIKQVKRRQETFTTIMAIAALIIAVVAAGRLAPILHAHLTSDDAFPVNALLLIGVMICCALGAWLARFITEALLHRLNQKRQKLQRKLEKLRHELLNLRPSHHTTREECRS